MNSDINDFLDRVDKWKLGLHEKLKGMSTAQRKAFWRQVHEDARQRGLPVVEPKKSESNPVKRKRRTA